jgi:hypothetical protein
MGVGGLRMSTGGIGSECVDSEPMGQAIVKDAGGHFEAHPTRGLACSLLIAALGLAGVTGCTGGGGAVPDAGEQPVNYTFDHGTDGWVLNKREGTSYANLGAGVPDGGSPPTVSFAVSDGDPSPGSLRLTLAFTGPWQYAAAGVVLGQARDLSGKTLHARVRRVSGPAAGVGAGFYACGFPDPAWGTAGMVCADLAMQIGVSELAEGAWAPLASDVVMVSSFVGIPGPSFTPASVVELGIEVFTLAEADAGAADGGTFASTGDVVFEIDTVTD